MTSDRTTTLTGATGFAARTRHLWILLLAVAGLVGCVGWWANFQIGGAIRQDVQDELQGTLEANVTALEIWMANQKRIASALAAERTVSETALEILALMENPGAQAGDPIMGDLLRQLNTQLQSPLSALDYRTAQIVTTNYHSVSIGFGPGRNRPRNSVRVPEELQPKFRQLFNSGLPIIITPFKLPRPGFGGRPPGRPPPGVEPDEPGPPEMERPRPPPRRIPEGGREGPRLRWVDRLREIIVMQVAAPMRDAEGHVRGALTLVIDPDTEFSRILSVAHSGDSAETFAFDSEGVMLSRSRFEPQLRQVGLIVNETNSTSALSLTLRDPGGDLTRGYQLVPTNGPRPFIRLVARAVEGTAGVLLTPFRDYRGVMTVGAWRWLPNYGFGVATKIDAREAFRPLQVTRDVFIVLFLLLVLASIVIFLFSYMQVVWQRRVTLAERKLRQLGQYQLEQQIGEGGMGVVYKAHHALLRRETALKLLPPDKADAQSVRRFEREVRLTCQLTHPNTIQVYDYGRTPDGIFYYAMEFLDGLTLSQLVRGYGPQSDGRVIHILSRVCESLNEAHHLGLIHRDIKPANIFVCDRGGVPDCIKVLDFGLVKSVSESLQHSRSTGIGSNVVGTPNYIAPETLKDPAQGDARSDLYSLGAVGYYLLTGQPVFGGASVIEICQKHLTEAPTPPSVRLGHPISSELEDLILRCLEKDPSRRPQSANELTLLLARVAVVNPWTLAERVAWWQRQRLRKANGEGGADQPTIRPVDATVRIAFSERTRQGVEGRQE